MKTPLVMLPYGLTGTVYRSPLPFSPLFDPRGRLLDSFIEVGVEVVVMLTPDAEVWDLTGRDLRSRYQDLGFDLIYAPVPDFAAPAEGAFQQPIHDTLGAARDSKTVVIHCHAGQGRTGTFAACLAKTVFNITGDEAVRWVRQFIPNAVENTPQYRFVQTFHYLED